MSVERASLLAKRYAGSFLDLMEGAKALSAAEKDMASLKNMLDNSADLRALVGSRAIGVSDQLAGIQAIATKAKFHKITQNFLSVLVQNRRLMSLPDIIVAFGQGLTLRKGDVSVSVTAAQDLSAKQMKDLQAQLEGALGRKAQIELLVDPEIMGGLIITIGSYMVDHSVRGKLERLQISMAGSANQNAPLLHTIDIKKEA